MIRRISLDIFSLNGRRIMSTQFSSCTHKRRLHSSKKRMIYTPGASFIDQKQKHDYWYVKEWDPRGMPETVDKRPVGVIGVPFSNGQPRVGTCSGPSSLREAGILDRIKDIGLQVNDRGDLSFDKIDDDKPMKNLKNPKTVVEASKKIRKAVSSCLEDGNRALILGGDHSMAIGAILGQADVQPDLCVMWIDAHADINTPLTSLTGNIHGMPLSFLVNELQPYLPKIAGFDEFKPCLSAKNLAYIGLRDVDPGERYIIETLGITTYSMQEVDKYGINVVLEKALKSIDPHGNRPIHFSFDVDAMDPSLAPSTGTPVPGGLSLRESFYIAEEMAATGRVSVIQMAEVNPKLGSDEDTEVTLSHTLQIVERCYGKQRQGIYPPGYVFPTP